MNSNVNVLFQAFKIGIVQLYDNTPERKYISSKINLANLAFQNNGLCIKYFYEFGYEQ